MKFSPIIEVDELLKIFKHPDVMIFDARNSKNAKADYEAEHLDGAFYIDLNTQNLNEEGLFLSPEELKDKYNSKFREVRSANIIIHCGSGVTACHTVLALACAGMEIPKLYVGSWSEWSRNNKAVQHS